MKKSVYFIAAVAMMAISCNKAVAPVENEVKLVHVSIPVEIEVDEATKVGMTMEGKKGKLSWQVGDQLAVQPVDELVDNPYILTAELDEETGRIVFDGVLSDALADGTKSARVFYPASLLKKTHEHATNIVLDVNSVSNQTSGGDVVNDAILLYYLGAVNGPFSVKVANALLKFTVNESDIEKIRFFTRSNDDSSVFAGDNINLGNGNNNDTNPSKKMFLTPAAGSTFDFGKDCYISLVARRTGLRTVKKPCVIYHKTDGTIYYRKSDNDLQYGVGYLIPMGGVSVNDGYAQLTSSYSMTGNNAYLYTNQCEVGTTITAKKTNHTNYDYWEIDCQPGDEFYVNTKGNQSSATTVVIDSDKKILYGVKGSFEGVIVAPEYATKLIVNNHHDNSANAFVYKLN